MDKAIEEMIKHDDFQRLMRLADYQERFTSYYANQIKDERLRDQFRQELIYLIHLTYREAQEPLMKQMMDFMNAYARAQS